MSNIDEFDKVVNDVLVENTAQTVFQHLERLERKKTSYASRWGWELLQNAHDAAKKQKEVNVCIEFNGERVTFKHDGQPFTNKQIAHLIYHGSTKQESEDNLGRFGTGFMTTHLLSRTVQVKGMLENNDTFDFCLNREGDTPEKLSISMNNSYDEFKNSLRENQFNSEIFTTIYDYPLRNDLIQYAEKGIDEILLNAPYVLAFNKKIKKIVLKKKLQYIEIKKLKDEIDNGVSLIHIEKVIDKLQEKFIIASIRDEDIMIALLFRQDGQDACKYVLSVDENTPKLFIAFPLLDTTSGKGFYFPVVVNSFKFEPTEERDRIYLSEASDEKTLQNRKLIENACKLSIKILHHLSAKDEWYGLHQLTKIKYQESDWFYGSWYTDLIKDLIAEFKSISLLSSMSGNYISPKDAIIPTGKEIIANQKVWDLLKVSSDYEDSLPKLEHLNDWVDIFKSWASFKQEHIEKFNEIISIEKLAKKINIDFLKNNIGKSCDWLKWGNDLHKLIIDSNLIKLFDELHLLINQNEQMCKRNIFKDEKSDEPLEKLKNIAEKLDCNPRSELLHNNMVHAYQELNLNEKTQDDILEETLNALRKKAEEAINDEFCQANTELFSWIFKNGKEENFNMFPAITAEQKTIIRLGRDKLHNTPLAPVFTWDSSFQEFKDLFPKRCILSDYYSECKDMERWNEIAQNNYIRVNPIYPFQKTLKNKNFLPSEPLKEDETHSTENSFTLTTFSFLRTKNIGMIDAIQQSKDFENKKKKAINLLRFVLNFVIENDKKWFNTEEVLCNCGEQHNYYNADWLEPLKHRQWIPIGKTQTSRPTPESLAQLLEGENEVLEKLFEESRRVFLNAIGINSVDLLLCSKAKNEEERTCLIQSAVNIFEATKGDHSAIEAITDELVHNISFLQEIKKRQKHREQIKRNQSIGLKIEKLLTNALRDENFSIDRTGIGHDYEIFQQEDEQEGRFINNNRNQFSIYIEIKSTIIDDGLVRMSLRQAEEAVKNKDNFILCTVFVDYSNISDINEETVRNNSFFILDIGSTIEPLYNKYISYKKDRPDEEINGIRVDIVEKEPRISVSSICWRKGKKFDELIDYLLSINKDNPTAT